MSLRDKFRSLGHILLPMTIVVWVLGSIYGGIASVTEAACMGVIGVFVSAIIRRELSYTIVRSALQQTMRTCGMIIWIGIGASAVVGIYNLMGGKRFTGLPLLGQHKDIDQRQQHADQYPLLADKNKKIHVRNTSANNFEWGSHRQAG